MTEEELENELINSYAEAYQQFGLNSLMGKIVALLLISPNPLSLDEISNRLEMSKGPVSQIARRLKEHRLIEKVWIPGDRKDYYRATDDIFGQAFRNQSSRIRQNKNLADRFLSLAEKTPGDHHETLKKRMSEMSRFYEMMEAHNRAFLQLWGEEREQL